MIYLLKFNDAKAEQTGSGETVFSYEISGNTLKAEFSSTENQMFKGFKDSEYVLKIQK